MPTFVDPVLRSALEAIEHHGAANVVLTYAQCRALFHRLRELEATACLGKGEKPDPATDWRRLGSNAVIDAALSTAGPGARVHTAYDDAADGPMTVDIEGREGVVLTITRQAIRPAPRARRPVQGRARGATRRSPPDGGGITVGRRAVAGEGVGDAGADHARRVCGLAHLPYVSGAGGCVRRGRPRAVPRGPHHAGDARGARRRQGIHRGVVHPHRRHGSPADALRGAPRGRGRPGGERCTVRLLQLPVHLRRIDVRHRTGHDLGRRARRRAPLVDGGGGAAGDTEAQAARAPRRTPSTSSSPARPSRRPRRAPPRRSGCATAGTWRANARWTASPPWSAARQFGGCGPMSSPCGRMSATWRFNCRLATRVTARGTTTGRYSRGRTSRRRGLTCESPGT